MYRLIIVRPNIEPIIVDLLTITDCLTFLADSNLDEIWSVSINYLGS